MDNEKTVRYDPAMENGHYVQAWRRFRRYSLEVLAEKAEMAPSRIEAIESGEEDPLISTAQMLSKALEIPPGWLFLNPKDFQILFNDMEEESDGPDTEHPDPVRARILLGAQRDQEMYVLLTALLQSGETRLIRAAEVNLRSLVKQIRQPGLPWESRISGHFEPPSD